MVRAGRIVVMIVMRRVIIDCGVIAEIVGVVKTPRFFNSRQRLRAGYAIACFRAEPAQRHYHH